MRVREEAVSIREATVEMKEKLVASCTSAKAEEERNQVRIFLHFTFGKQALSSNDGALIGSERVLCKRRDRNLARA